MFKVDTGKNIYTTTRKVKRETVNLFQHNYKPDRYLEKFLSNIKVAKQKECRIWLDNGTIMSELKITKGSTITWETADLENRESKGSRKR